MGVIVDTIKTSFSNLFTIRLGHAGYESSFSSVVSSSILKDLSTTPDEKTKKLFKDFTLGYVLDNNILICYIRNITTKAFLPLPDSTIIRFLVRTQARFINKTIIQSAGSNQVYQFTNLGRTGGGTDKYLTKTSGGVTDNDLQDADVIAASENCFAVIDIYTKDVGNDYRLFDVSGNLLGGNYKISFTPK